MQKMGNVRRRGLAVLLHHQFPEIESVQEIEKVIALFEKADLEHNGRVDKEEFKVLLEEFRKSGSATVAGSADKMLVDLVFSALDKDDSGDLNLEEILAGYHTLFADERMELARLISPSFPSLSEKQIVDILKLFERFDDNGNGIIDKHEFYQLKQELAPSIVSVLQEIQKEKNGAPLVESDFLRAYQHIFGSRTNDAPHVAAAAEAALTAALSTGATAGGPPDSPPPVVSSSTPPPPSSFSSSPSSPSSSASVVAAVSPPSRAAEEPKRDPIAAQQRALPPVPTTSSPSPLQSTASTPSPAPAITPVSHGPTVSPAQKSPAAEPMPSTATPSVTSPSLASSSQAPQRAETASTSTSTSPTSTSNSSSAGEARAAGPSQLWDAFVASEEPLEARRLWEELKAACQAPPIDGDASTGGGGQAYTAVRDRLIGLPRWKPFFQLLDKKRAQKEYVLDSPAAADKPRVLVVGAGPGGLRTAIEALLLGSRVTMVEMRKRFTRHNLLHIWNSSIRDLRNIGAKFLYPQFCTGGINHVSIRRLQLVLLKVALMLGLHYRRGAYAGAQGPEPGTGLWRATVKSKESIEDDDLRFNVLVGADGERSSIADEFGFERKLFKGSDAIGITANFVNTQTPEEKQLDEFGLLAIYNQPFFNELKAKSDIELENLVYYRNETHYFVMTAKRSSLLRRGVLRQDGPVETVLLSRDNVDAEKLEAYVREVADHISLPAHCGFMKNSRGANDVAIFDFSKKQQATAPAKIVREGSAKLLVALVGDSLVEPFWPQGTGANRAILGALDTAWMIKTLFERGGSPEQQLLDEWVAEFKVMVSSSPDDLQSNLGAFTIDPKTRYKKMTVTHFM